jgi:hypothetical protein
MIMETIVSIMSMMSIIIPRVVVIMEWRIIAIKGRG